jgi:DNA-binding CsgD family transcriptional regulator
MKEVKMVDEPSIGTQDRVTRPDAFIVYRPEIKTVKEAVFQNREALEILTYSTCSSEAKKTVPDVSSLCSKWRRLLEKKTKMQIESRDISTEESGSEPYFLEVIRSGRRKYMVKGMVLLGRRPADEQEINYLFLLERICPEKINVPLIARNWNLSQREQDIVRLLFADRGNKEISYLLGLSINTIKTYMKFLMRKLGVSSRAGIVSCLLTKHRAGIIEGTFKKSLFTEESAYYH